MKEMIINWLRENKQIILTFLGSFFGAFFAFCFFVIGEKWRKKEERRKTYINEHAYLERYLNYIVIILGINVKFYELIKKQYQDNQLALRNLQNFPIREDSSMKLCDLIFLNKIENFLIKLKQLNSDIDLFNNTRGEMNSRIEKFIIEQQRQDLKKIIEDSLAGFIQDSEVILNFQKMLKDEAMDLLAENNFLYQFYRLNFLKRKAVELKIKFRKQHRESKISEIKKKILQQSDELQKREKERYRKYGIIK